MRFLVSAFLSLLICFTAALPLCAQPHAIHAVTSGGTIQLQIPNLHYDFHTINVKGTKFIKPEILNAAEATRQPHVGAPDIPYLTTLIALPSEALPTIEITDQQSYIRTQQNIYIAQALDQSSRSQKNIPGSAHTASVSNASQLIVLGKPEIMRGMYVVPVRINPLQFNPTTGELRVYTSIKFFLHTSGFKATVNRVPLAGSAIESNAWEEYARPLIANYRDALQWRTIPLRKNTAAPARMMLSPGQQRVKMFVNRNSIYRITGNDLNAIGAPLSSMDPRTFHVYCFHNVTPSIPFMPDTGATPLPPYQADTIEVPLYLTGAADGSFDAGDTLQFYGRMHYGEEGDFYDDFTDDNAYWLTWGGSTNQELYTAQTQLPSASEQDWSVKSDHYEKDVNYFLGDNVNGDYGTIYVADKVPGERFYWQTLDPNSQSTAFNQSFTIGGLPDAQGNATLRIHMRGISGDSAFLPDHNIEIFLNFDSVAFVQFNEWQDTIVTLTFPCKKLRNGKNDLSLLSLPPAGSAPGNYVDQVAVDFYEVITPQQYVFSGDSLEFNAPAGGVSQFTLQNVRSPQVTVYNTTTGKIPMPVSSLGGTFIRAEGRGFLDSRYARIQVQDSIAVASTYARGFNVVTVDPATGEPTDYKQFDTYQSQSASADLVQYISSIPNGAFIVIATCDEVTVNLTPAARAAIQSLGSADIQQLASNDSWVFVCQKGNASFTPVEDLSRAGTGAAHLVATIPTATQRSWQFVLRDSTVAGAAYIAQTSGSIPPPRQIELRNTPTLHATTNGADYIIITHRNFMTAAQKLAQYRAQHNNYRTAVVDVEDIYDDFNGGVMREMPIRDFLKYAYTSWQAPAPAIVALMGDASWDSKMNSPGAWRSTYVPSYGRPVSDFWYTLLDGNDLLPEIMIGRIAVPTEDTAMAMINKIISYESAPPEQWNKKFLFITGGFTAFETIEFLYYGTNANIAIAFAPICAEATFISRDDYTGKIQTSKTDSIVGQIDAGTLWMNYFGHGAPTITDISFGAPQDLSNTTSFPFFTTYACQTGAFAEPTGLCLNEAYADLPTTGFIASWGNSSFGDAFLDGVVCDDAYGMLAQDSLVQLGMLTEQTKLEFWSGLNYGIGDPYDSINGRNMLYNQNLLGDPGLALAIRVHPDVAISDSDVTVQGASSGVITDQDTAVTLRLIVRNNGFSSNDTMHVLVHDDYAGGSYDMTLTVVVPCEPETLSVSLPLHHVSGTHQITVTLDPDQKLPYENYRANNVAHAGVVVYSAVSGILRPQNFGSLAGNCQANTLSALIPQYGGNTLRYYFQLDTSVAFNSGSLLSSPPITPSGTPVVQWQIPVTLADNVAYYWRIRSYDPVKNDTSIWENASFVNSGAPWQQIGTSQFAQDALTSLTAERDGVHLGVVQGIIDAESRGYYNGDRFVHVQLGNQTPYTNNQIRGMYFFVLSDTAFVLDQTLTTSIDIDATPDSSNAQKMANLIDSIPTGRIVIAAVMDDISSYLTQGARDAMKLLGAAQADSIGFRDSYVLIGKKGASPGSVPEMRVPGGDSVFVHLHDTIPFAYLRGRIVSAPIGPATQWGSAQWSTQLFPATAGTVSVFGLNRSTNLYDSLSSYNAQTGSADLSHIVDPRKYRYIELAAALTRSVTNVEPVLQKWSATFTSAPELTGYAPSLAINPDTVLEGTPSSLAVDVYNVGCITAKNIFTQSILQDPAAKKISGSQVIDSLPPMGFTHVQMPLTTAGVEGLQSVVFTIDPNDSITELVKTNNTLAGSMYVRRDTTPPSMVVTIDGRQILNGDFVRPTPDILVKVMDNSPLVIHDPSSITIKISNFLIGTAVYSAVKTPKNMTFTSDSSGNIKANADLHPDTLAPGLYTMDVYATDATGNIDSTEIQFQVVTNASLQNVMNAPDPFQNNTNFTFVLSGENPPDGAVIKVYTVAGRLIRVIDVPPTNLRVGFNAIPWDGTDADGSRIANGVYIYKLIVHLPGQDLIETQKLAVLR